MEKRQNILFITLFEKEKTECHFSTLSHEPTNSPHKTLQKEKPNASQHIKKMQKQKAIITMKRRTSDESFFLLLNQ